MAESNVWVAETACTGSVFHTKTNASTVVQSYCERKTAVCRRRCRLFLSLKFKILTSSNEILCTRDIFSILVLLFLLYFEYSSTLLIYLIASRIHGILSKSDIRPYMAASIPAKKRRLFRPIWERHRRDSFFSSPCNSETLISTDISHTT
jgi:hypothetical protein